LPGSTASSIAALIVSAVIFRLRNRAAFLAVGLVALGLLSNVQSVWAANGGVGEFYRSIVGDWVGTCEQSTDGVKADNKYFHAVVKQLSPSEFVTHFEYFKVDRATGRSAQIGESQVRTVISPNGAAASVITGKGTVLVNNKPKPQEHELTETQTCTAACSLEGTGTGKVKVGNMPLGLGKNGKVRESKTAWSLTNGVLAIDQKLRVAFSALIFSKSFTLEAHYTARRGTDVASVMAHRAQVSAVP
jgi:hypothetical protein